MTLTAGFLLKLCGYDVVIYISILTNIFSLILLIRLIPSGKTFKRYQSKTFKDIFLTLKNIVEQKKEFLYLICLYGVLSFLAWQFHSISSLVLLDMKLSSFDVALCGSILKAVMAIGALMSIIFFSKGAKLYNCVLVLLSVCLLGVISAFFYNKYIFYTFCLLVVLFYTVIEVSIERKFEFYSDKTVRGTAVSIAMTFCSLLSIISNLIVGCIAQKYSYRTALIVLMLTIMLMIICLSTKLFFDKNQKEVQK
jgi:MFS family permease